MLISWINKFSMIDFPGKTSCVIFTLGCNMRCSFCHNAEFVLPELYKDNIDKLISQKAIMSFLEKRKWLLEWVSICWWEPTLQADLLDFCKQIKSMWYAVKLDTNWRDYEILQKLLDKNLVDYIAMDIKNPIWKFQELTCVDESDENYKKSIQILLDSKIDYEFRTTVIKWFHDEKSIKNIGKSISWAKNYYLQNYRSWNTLDPSFKWEKFNNSELEKLQKIAEKFVDNCGVRN